MRKHQLPEIYGEACDRLNSVYGQAPAASNCNREKQAQTERTAQLENYMRSVLVHVHSLENVVKDRRVLDYILRTEY